jgi:hypothetical protein
MPLLSTLTPSLSFSALTLPGTTPSFVHQKLASLHVFKSVLTAVPSPTSATVQQLLSALHTHTPITTAPYTPTADFANKQKYSEVTVHLPRGLAYLTHPLTKNFCELTQPTVPEISYASPLSDPFGDDSGDNEDSSSSQPWLSRPLAISAVVLHRNAHDGETSVITHTPIVTSVCANGVGCVGRMEDAVSGMLSSAEGPAEGVAVDDIVDSIKNRIQADVTVEICDGDGDGEARVYTSEYFEPK